MEQENEKNSQAKLVSIVIPCLKFFTGSEGGPPRSERGARTERLELSVMARYSQLAVLVAGEPPAVPVKSLTDHPGLSPMKLITRTGAGVHGVQAEHVATT